MLNIACLTSSRILSALFTLFAFCASLYFAEIARQSSGKCFLEWSDRVFQTARDLRHRWRWILLPELLQELAAAYLHQIFDSVHALFLNEQLLLGCAVQKLDSLHFALR